MKCNVEEFHMNVRYRVLNINNERYILDMGGSSLWRLIFPFFYWMFPLRAYHVDQDEVIDKLTFPHKEQGGTAVYALFGGVISLMLGNLIYPIVENMNVEITSMTSALIISVIFILILAFYVYANRLLGRKLHRHINVEKLPKKKIWVRPKSKTFIIQLLLFYLFALAMCVGFIAGAIELPNGFMFFASSIALLLTLTVGFATVRSGETTVQFTE